MLFRYVEETLTKFVNGMTPEQADKISDFINNANAELCRERRVAVIDTGAYGPNISNRNDGFGENDPSPVSVTGQATR